MLCNSVSAVEGLPYFKFKRKYIEELRIGKLHFYPSNVFIYFNKIWTPTILHSHKILYIRQI